MSGMLSDGENNLLPSNLV